MRLSGELRTAGNVDYVPSTSWYSACRAWRDMVRPLAMPYTNKKSSIFMILTSCIILHNVLLHRKCVDASGTWLSVFFIPASLYLSCVFHFGHYVHYELSRETCDLASKNVSPTGTHDFGARLAQFCDVGIGILPHVRIWEMASCRDGELLLCCNGGNRMLVGLGKLCILLAQFPLKACLQYKNSTICFLVAHSVMPA